MCLPLRLFDITLGYSFSHCCAPSLMGCKEKFLQFLQKCSQLTPAYLPAPCLSAFAVCTSLARVPVGECSHAWRVMD